MELYYVQVVCSACQVVTLPREYTLLQGSAHLPNVFPCMHEQKSWLGEYVLLSQVIHDNPIPWEHTMECSVYTSTAKGMFTPFAVLWNVLQREFSPLLLCIQSIPLYAPKGWLSTMTWYILPAYKNIWIALHIATVRGAFTPPAIL